jgi:hypothetical protein
VNKKLIKTTFLLVILLTIFVMSIPEAMAQNHNYNQGTVISNANFRRVNIPQRDRAKVREFMRHDGTLDQRRVERQIGTQNFQRARYYSQHSRVNLMDILMLYLIFRNWNQVGLMIGHNPAPAYPTYPGYYPPAYRPLPPGYVPLPPVYQPMPPMYQPMPPVYQHQPVHPGYYYPGQPYYQNTSLIIKI